MARHGWLGLIILALLHATEAPVLGQEPAPPPVTPPVAQASTDVPYPAGADGDAAVLLELLVEADGSVSSATVVEGVEPFAEQARAAALTWKFSPARRGDTAIPVRIRARVEFHHAEPPRPPPRPPAGPATPATPATPAPAPEPEAPLDVTVRGTRREIGQTTLSAADVREMPGAFGDPFRAVEALPGVTPVVSGLPFFYVRGAPPNDSGYFVDGVRVPLLFHVGIGEGVIHPALLDHVDFFPGAPPAGYGGFAGAIIAGQTREPATSPHGQANLRLFDAGGLVETPVGGDRGSVLVAGRYGYPGPILSAVTSSVKLGYWDYQARATWRLGEKSTLGLFAFGSHDYLGTVAQTNSTSQPEQTVEQIGSDFHRLDLRYDRALARGRLRIAGTLGYDSQGGAGGSDGAPPATITNRLAALRLELDDKVASSARIRAGIEGRIEKYGFEQDTLLPNPSGAVQPPVPATVDPPPTNMTAAAHLDLVWRLAPRLEIVPGVRLSVFDSNRASAPAGDQTRTTVPAFDPRLSARVTVTPALAAISTVGISHQYPALRAGPLPGLILSAPGFPFGDTHLQRAIQASQGVEVSLPAEVTLTATGFLSLWSGLTDLTALCIQVMPPTTPPPTDPSAPPPPYVCPDDQPVSGHAYGVELLVRRPLSKRLAGWLSYTLSRSTREAHFATLSGGTVAANVASEFDRTHVLNAILAYDLGRAWRAGARFVYYTGAPYSNLAGNVPVPPYNGYRGPSFFRLDVRLEKRWSLGKGRSLAFVLEGLNVTLSREVNPLATQCRGDMTPQGGTTQCTQGRFGPLTIPSIGVEVFF
jgi:TonB family protein